MHHTNLIQAVLRGFCLAAAAAVLALGSAPVLAGASTDVPVANPSFEAQVLAPGGFFFSPTPITGWTATATGGSDRGVWHVPAIGQDGNNVAFFGGGNSAAQVLGHAIVPNSTYTVEFLYGSIGQSAVGVVELYAGGTVGNGVVTGGTLLESLVVTRDPFNALMTAHSFDWSSPLHGLHVGEMLSIRLAYAAGVSVSFFDNIQVSYAPVPEPAAAALLLAGLGTLLGSWRRQGAKAVNPKSLRSVARAVDQ